MGLDKEPCRTRRQSSHPFGVIALRCVFGRSSEAALGRPPLNEIVPENNTMKGRKAGQMEPTAGRRIGHSNADGELLDV